MTDSGNPSDRRLVWRTSYPERNLLHLLEAGKRGSSVHYKELLDRVLETRGFRDSRDRSEIWLRNNDLFAVLRDYDGNIVDILMAEGNDIAWTSNVPDDVREDLMNTPPGDPKDIDGRDGVQVMKSPPSGG